MDTTQTTTPPAQPNPALKALEFLVGDWTMELSNASFLSQPTDKVGSPVSFEWVQDGAFLAMRMGDKSSTPAALWLIHRDESVPGYTVLYYDARWVSRVYAMSFADNTWKIWRESPGFWQRFTGAVSPDRKMISASWEKSPDGTTWEHDFDVTYTKVR